VGSHLDAVERVLQLGRRYAVGIRVVTIIPIAVVAVLADPSKIGTALVVMTGLACWSAIYLVVLIRGRVRGVTFVDALVVCCIGVVAADLTPATWLASGKSWVRPFTTFASVGYQYSTSWRIGVPAGVAACTVVAVSSSLAQPGPLGVDTVVTAVWSNAIPMLGRLLFSLITRAASRADGMRAEADAARLKLEVADSVRADERLTADSLHDTAATTLLMVAMRPGAGLDEAIRERARHDLAVLHSMRTAAPPEPVDLCAELRAAAARCTLAVDVTGPEALDIASTVARALADAAAEALTNVARHAATARAQLRFGDADRVVFVEVIDAGCGFDPTDVAATRRGLRTSIIARVETVGGTAEIVSAPGSGTRIRLTWPR